MPIPITDYSDSNASSELKKAGIAGLWLGLSTETGGRMLGAGFKSLGRGLKSSVMPAGRGLYRAAKFTGNVGARAASIYGGGGLRDIAAGGVHGATQAVSWLYRHPVSTAALAGGLGLAVSTLDPNERLSNEVSVTPSPVEAMGGTSTQGARQLMDMMNASGNIVLGAHNRR